MQTKVVDVQDAQFQLTELLALVTAGTEIILTEGNTPRARIVSISEASPRIAGLHPGAMQTSDDFDEPLPDEIFTDAP